MKDDSKGISKATSKGLEIVKRGMPRAADKSGELISKAGKEFRARVGDNYLEIFDKNPMIIDVLEKKDIIEANPIMLDTFYNVKWRSGLILSGLATGVLLKQKDIIDFTRKFHDLGTSHGHEKLSRILFGDPMTNIHSEVIDATSGTRHRLDAGHDVVGLVNAIQEKGIKGGLAWFQHMAQDFTTPRGVPPAIDSSLYQESLSTLGINKHQAALLLSLNAATMLAGILAVVAIVRLWQSGVQIVKNIKVKNYCLKAMEYHEEEDYSGAITMFKEALDISPNNPRLLVPLGFVYLEQRKNRLNAHRVFEEAGRALAKRDEQIDFNGVDISMRGLSYALALSTSDVIVSHDYNKDHWKEYLRELIISGATSFNRTAKKQSERRILKHIPGGPLLPAKHMSAASNYYLGAKILASCPIIENQDDEVVRYLDKAGTQLSYMKEAEKTLSEKVDFLNRFWRAELIPASG